MPDYIPKSLSEFIAWLNNLVNVYDKNKAKFNVSATLTGRLTAAHVELGDAVQDYEAKRTAFETAGQRLQDAQDEAEDAARGVVNVLQADPNTTDADRTEFRISKRDRTRTAPQTPDTHPVAEIDFSQRAEHRLHYKDQSTPTSKARPKGVRYARVQYKIGGGPPVSTDELLHVKNNNETPCLITFKAEDLGKPVYYQLRWVNTQEEEGPWSPVYSALVAG